MAKCSFCGGGIPDNRGKMAVKNDGRILWYCSSKCEKNSGLGRAGKKTRWTLTARKAKQEAKK